jgi:tetratricopeptide (TPR) repeat protein
MHLGYFDKAEMVLSEAIDRWPDDTFLNGLRAINKLKQADYAAAIQLATAALGTARIEHRIGWMVIARSRWLLNEHGMAAEAFKKVLDQDPNNAAALLALAELHGSMGQQDTAKIYLKRVLDLKGIDYLQKGVRFDIEAENVMPYIPDEHAINELIRDMNGNWK